MNMRHSAWSRPKSFCGKQRKYRRTFCRVIDNLPPLFLIFLALDLPFLSECPLLSLRAVKICMILALGNGSGGWRT